jgi:plastocyanin
MHTAALHLAPVLGAEKSKVPFYIAGGLLVAWALIVSLGLGLRRTDFPGSLAGQRAVMAISAVLVIAAVATAVITSGTPAPAGAASSAASSTTGGPLKLAANAGGQLSYDTKQLSAKAGAVTVAFTNVSPLEHNLTIAQGSTVLGATPTFTGASKALTLTLKPGTYTFYCSVPGHRQAGMEGTLKVA